MFVLHFHMGEVFMLGN